MPDTQVPHLAFLAGGGEMGALMRAHDWAATPLGAAEHWPQALRTIVRLILNTQHPMYMFWGEQGLCFYNDAYRTSIGSERHPSSLGQPAREVWSEIWEVIGPQIEQVMAGRGATWNENHLVPITRNGRREDVYWTYSYSPIDAEGAPHDVGGTLVTCTETTALVLAERMHAKGEEALRGLNATLEQQVAGRTHELDRAWRLAQELLVIARPDGTIEAINPRWAQLLGYVPADIVGRPFVEFTHPEDIDATLVAFASILEQPLVTPYEYRFRHKDGSYRWFGWTGAFEDGKVHAAGRDISHEREREAILRDTQDFARLALSAAGGVGVWTYEVASDLFFYDAAIATLYALDPTRGPAGIPRTEFLANVHPGDRAALKATMSGGLVRSGDLELEYRICHPDGSVRYVLSRGHTYHDAKGRPVRRTGVGVDTTNQRQTEEALRQSQKMEAVGQLTGGLAHDFNNLLAGISGSLELMQTRLQQGRLTDVDRYMTAALGAARRAAALTHRLLAFSRRQTLDPKPTDVTRLAMGMQELIQRAVGPGITVEVVGATSSWPALVDQSQLENALLNLCINARDAMPEGGRITVETANKWMDERAARLHDVPQGQYLSLSVTDTGTGIPPEVIARVFEPFFTTKPIGEGTGLGLSMIYGFAQQSGGQVRIYSEVGEGTTVSIYLPRHYGAVEDDNATDTAAELPRSQDGETVLIVDDEPTVRMLVTDILEDLGYAAIEASDSATGFKVLQSDVRIDLLVTDVGLPGGMNGRQMADAAREHRPDLKVLFITGYAENSILGNGHLRPGMAVLTKPFAVEIMAARIRSMIEAGKEPA